MKKKRAMEILEEDKIPNYEMPLVKRRGGDWEELPAKRGASKIDYKKEDLQYITQGKPYSFLHTHPRLESDTKVKDKSMLVDEKIRDVARVMGKEPITDKEMDALRYSPSFPSDQDILSFLGDEKHQFMEVAQRDPVTGKVAGIYFVKKTKNSIQLPPYPKSREATKEKREEWLLNSNVQKVFECLESSGYNSPEFYSEVRLNDNQRSMTQNALDKVVHTLGLRIRYVPAKGYEYVQGFGFEKKRHGGKSLEHHVTSMLAIGSLTASLFFLSSGLTGNVIADLSLKASNWVGGALFMAGVGLALFHFRRKIFKKK